MEVLAALAALKRKDLKAFKSVLLDLDIERWQDIKENSFGEVIATCQAKLDGGEIDNNAEGSVAELADPKLGLRDTLDRDGLARNAKSEITAGIGNDLALTINSAPTLAEGFNNAAKMLHARNANRAAATAE
jgi:hypothetical protein